MKKLFYILAVFFAVSACQGYADPEDPSYKDDEGENVEIPDAYTAPFTLSVDKETIEADGSDQANFSLKDAYDREMLTDMNALSSINFIDQYGNYLERRSVSVRAIENGYHTYTASYKGVKSNSVQVKAQNREQYEKYYKRVAIYKITGTGCVYCPSMTKALNALDEDAAAHSVQMAWHGGTSWDDPFALYFPNSTYDCALVLQDIFSRRTGKTLGFPSLVLDLDDAVTQRSASVISGAIWNQRAEHPATCGLKMSSEYNGETSKVDIDVELTSSTGGSYDVGVALLLDGEYVADGKEEDGIYNHIVISNSGNYYTYFSDRIADVAKDASKSYTFSLGNEGMDLSSKASRISVVAYALVADEEGVARIDNIVSAPLGEDMDYLLNSDIPVAPDTPGDSGDEPDNGDSGEGGSGQYTDVPEGTLRIFADKTEIVADGADEVTFTIMYGSQDVSNAKTLQLIRVYEGDEKYMSYGVNKFTTMTAGTYTFKAKYYYAGNKYTDNEVEIVAEPYQSGEERSYARNVLAAYFTSTGCTSCPSAYRGLKEVQEDNPGVVSVVAFHEHMTISDPMRTTETDLFKSALGNFTGLPRLFWNLRPGTELIGPKFTDSFAEEIASYEPECGVAINTEYDPDTRKLDIKVGVTSNLPMTYRYLVFLVEDNMDSKVLGDEYKQCGDHYVHHNVVRDVLSSSAAGAKLNDDLPLTVGVEAIAKNSVTLSENWNPDNMRVIVSAMSSTDGGVTWVANNTNECKVGESVSYEYAE